MSLIALEATINPSPADTNSTVAVILGGLSALPKTLPSELLYDEAGSALFEKITEHPAYYVPRTELALLKQSAEEIVASLPGPQECPVALVEFGASSEAKALHLLDGSGQSLLHLHRDRYLAERLRGAQTPHGEHASAPYG